MIKNITENFPNAFIAKGKSAVDSINLIKPDFYFKGNDYKNNYADSFNLIKYKEVNFSNKPLFHGIPGVKPSSEFVGDTINFPSHPRLILASL